MTEQLPAGLRWIAFDLDGTLHDFERASGQAADAVFREIERRSGIGIDDLGDAYSAILSAAQQERFVRSKTSREYRGERFAALLAELDQPSDRLDRLLDIYDEALGEALELKPGARQALIDAKRARLSVMVISEGPQDAQARTIDRLGIAPSIDLLVTSAAEGVSKTDGLFERALERARCSRDEIVYVGDSIDRDIVPASALGIASVYVGEGELPDGPAAIRLDLEALGRLLSRLAEQGARPCAGTPPRE
jgi:putative hydrolase of the HAD superfamily